MVSDITCAGLSTVNDVRRLSEAQLAEVTPFPGHLGRVVAALQRIDTGIQTCFTDEQLQHGLDGMWWGCDVMEWDL